MFPSPREILLEQMMTQKQFRSQPKTSCLKQRGKPSRQSGDRDQSNSKVTVPKPFQMMLREEERKKHKVRTRSEIELENMLLKRELEELRECQKKFRASPAPAHIHLPLYEIISRRPSQQPNRSRSSSRSSRDTKSRQTAASPQPFNFLEREKRKREAKIVAALGNFGQKVEQQTFKARPMPSSVYGTRHRADTETSQRCPSSKPVKKHIELSIEMVQDREWSYADPPKTTTCSVCSTQQPAGPDPLLNNKSDYVSV